MCNFYLRWEMKIMTLHCRCEQICLRSLWFLDHARYNPVTFLHNCPPKILQVSLVRAPRICNVPNVVHEIWFKELYDKTMQGKKKKDKSSPESAESQ